MKTTSTNNPSYLLYAIPVVALCIFLLFVNGGQECYCAPVSSNSNCPAPLTQRVGDIAVNNEPVTSTDDAAKFRSIQDRDLAAVVGTADTGMVEPPPLWINSEMKWDPYSEKAPCHNVTAIVPGQIHGDQLFSFAVKYYDHAKFVETGVLFGQGSAYIATLAREAKKDIKLYSIDVYYWWTWMDRLISSWQRNVVGDSYVGQPGCAQSGVDVRNGWASDIGRIRRQMKLGYDTLPMVEYFWRRAGLHHSISAGKMDSIIGAAFFSQKSLAFVYLDTDHTYHRTIAEIRAWWPKMAPGGTLSGDDFSRDFEGVKRAVRDCFGDAFAVSQTDPPQWAVQKAAPNLPTHKYMVKDLLCDNTEHKFQDKPYLKQNFVGDKFI